MRKIVCVGPESTGKSTLCEQLAHHYKTVWCPEFAREYLQRLSAPYTYPDLIEIARGQMALQHRLEVGAKKFYFIDTDMYVMKVWSEFVFADCHRWILKQIATQHYDLYLLCNTDLPWVADDLREYPDLALRQRLYKMYRDAMVNSGVPWIEISGNSEQRFHTAVREINKRFTI